MKTTNTTGHPLTLVLASAAAAAFLLAAGAEEAGKTAKERVFTDDQGREIIASVVGIKRGYVELRKASADATTYQFPIAKLSAADRDYLKQWLMDNGVLELEIREKPSQSVSGGPPPGEPKMPGRSPGNRSNSSDLKAQQDVKMSWDKSQYEIEIRNNSGLELKGAELAYRVQVLREDYANRATEGRTDAKTPLVVEGKLKIPDLPVGKTIKLMTEPFDLFYRRWEEEVTVYGTDSEGNQTTSIRTSNFRIRHELEGVDVKVMMNGRAVSHYQTEDRKVKPVQWQSATPYSPSDFSMRAN